jgi:hypothetical protein
VAAKDMPPAAGCFAVDFVVDFVVEHYDSFKHTMASSQRKVETLKKIIQNSSIDLVCPLCLKGFPRPDPLYRHFREQGDDTHAGLHKRKSKKQSDMEEFLTCYRESVKASVAVEDMPLDSHCFAVDFVVEHYGEHTGMQR